MMKKLFSIFIIMAVLVITSCAVAFAKPVDIQANGQYRFTANDTRETAKRAAVKVALRDAAEQGAVYVEAYSEANNFEITKDEAEIVAAAIVKVYDETISYSNNGTVCHVTLYCTVNTDGIDIDKILKRNRKKSGEGKKSSNNSNTPSVRYSGVIIDALSLDPGTFTVNSVYKGTTIMSEDGRIIYDLMTPEPKYGTDNVWDSYGADVDNKRGAGNNPYWAKALYIYNPNQERFPSTFVISDADADAILAQQKAYGILNGKEKGRIVVIQRRM